VGQLIKLLVADPQCGSDVLWLRAVQDQALHSTVERRPGNVGFVLGMDQPLLGLPGLGQPLLIHVAHSSQMLRGLAERCPASSPSVTATQGLAVILATTAAWTSSPAVTFSALLFSVVLSMAAPHPLAAR
jgi:hypothetical protein